MMRQIPTSSTRRDLSPTGAHPRPWQHSRFAAIGLIGLVLAALTAGCGGGGSPPLYTASFREFPVPAKSNMPGGSIPGSWPDDLRGDTEGDIWFAQHHADEIGRMTPTGQYTGFPVPTSQSVMDSIVVDKANLRVWASEELGNKIARVDIATGVVTEVPVPTPNAVPGDLALAPDGSVWFTEGYEGGGAPGRIAHLNPNNSSITEISLPNPRGNFDGITVTPAGVVWFVEIDDDRIGRYANGQITEFPLPRVGATPTNIAIDIIGRAWITEQSANMIGIFNPADNSWKEIPIPTPNSEPAGIFIDPRGSVWFTEFNAGKIGVVPTGTATVRDYAIPTPNSGPEDIFAMPDGTVWFTEQYGDKIGRISVTGLTPP